MEKITLKKARKIIRETIRGEEPKTFYVANSSYFDSNPYQTNEIARAVRKAGGKNIKAENAYGWTNQPEVVLFDAAEEKVEDIAAAVSRALRTDWIHIREKDW